MDKLTILNRALGETGNNKLSMLADPAFPDEWDVASEAFERRIDDLASRHNWPFGRKRAALVLAGTDATQRWQYSFNLPSDMLHLRGILNETTLLTEGWEQIGNLIRSYYSTGLYALYNYEPPDAQWHPQAAEILTLFMEASILRGLNEDFKEADLREARAEARLGEGRAFIGQQNPALNTYRSSIRTARRTRRA